MVQLHPLHPTAPVLARRIDTPPAAPCWRGFFWASFHHPVHTGHAKTMLKLPDKGVLVALGVPAATATMWAPFLREACARYDITGKQRLAMFLAQVLHESARLTRLVENLNYSAAGLRATWPRRFTPATAAQYARKPSAIADLVYANRMGNGPQSSGDGWRYRGRGPLQATGKAMYAAITTELQRRIPGAPNFVAAPEKLLEPRWGAWSAGFIWTKVKGLNQIADAGNFDLTTARINGGQIGRDDRIALYRAALAIVSRMP